MARSRTPSTISLSVRKPSELFESLDGSEFNRKELTKEAERFITDWARDLPKDSRPVLTIKVPKSLSNTKQARAVPEAIQAFFGYRAQQADRDLREQLVEGRNAALVGLPLLVICLLSSHYIQSNVEEPALATLFGESLLILGWVANWTPLQIFLYDWWPIRRRARFFRRLEEADVRIAEPSQDRRQKSSVNSDASRPRKSRTAPK